MNTKIKKWDFFLKAITEIVSYRCSFLIFAALIQTVVDCQITAHSVAICKCWRETLKICVEFRTSNVDPQREKRR